MQNTQKLLHGHHCVYRRRMTDPYHIRTLVLVDPENNFAKENYNCLNVKLWQFISVIPAGISNAILKSIINVLRDHLIRVWF